MYLYLIRHSQSETNVSNDYSIQDPNLTPFGISQAKADQDKVLEFINAKRYKVFSSVLVRSQETGLVLFPDKTITVANYLKESAYDDYHCKGSNYPLQSPKLQQEKMKKIGISPDNLKYEKDLVTSVGNYKQPVMCKSGDIMTFLAHHKFKTHDHVVLIVHFELIKNFLRTRQSIPNGGMIQVWNESDKTFIEPFHLGKLYFKNLNF